VGKASASAVSAVAVPTAEMGQHFQDGVAAIRTPFVVYDAEERIAAFNQAFADLHREADGSTILYPGMPFQALMEWRLRTGFFAADVANTAAEGTEFRLALGDVIY
jgi:hypothetical protein